MSESRKAKLTEDLARFYAYKHIPFDKPNYRRIEKLPFNPLEVEVDISLVQACWLTQLFCRMPCPSHLSFDGWKSVQGSK